jgi:hypothetical protein
MEKLLALAAALPENLQPMTVSEEVVELFCKLGLSDPENFAIPSAIYAAQVPTVASSYRVGDRSDKEITCLDRSWERPQRRAAELASGGFGRRSQ